MHQFSLRPKLLLFYGGTIAAVLVLFRLTTAYGETRLQAPPNVDGTYLSSIAPPGCPADSRLQLTVQQSGIYLNGSVALIQSNTSPEVPHSASSERLPLTGRWQQGEIALSGNSNALANCQGSAANAVQIKGAIDSHNAKQFTGTLQTDNSPSVWSFIADRQAEAQTAEH